MKRSLLAAGVAASLLLVGACGSASDAPPEPADDAADTSAQAGEAEADGEAASAGNLDVWTDDTRLSVLEGAAADFEAETGVSVNLIEKDFGDIRDDFVAMQPSGEAPDVIVGGHDWLGVLVTNGVLAPIEFADIVDDFNPAAIQAVTYNSTTYGLPYAVENIALLRNDDVTEADIPDTFDELIDLGKSLETTYPVMIQQDAAEGDPYTVYPVQTSFGAPVFTTDEDGNYTSELGMSGEAGEAFADYLKKLGDDGVLNPSNGYDEVLNAFIEGETGFIIGGPWMIADIKEAGVNVSVHPIPSAGGEAAQPFLGVQAFFINADAENPIAANEFVVNYLASEEIQLSLYDAGDRTPALTAAAEEVASDPLQEGFALAGENGAPMPAIPEMASVWEFWGSASIGIASGQGDPGELWNTMIDNVENSFE